MYPLEMTATLTARCLRRATVAVIGVLAAASPSAAQGAPPTDLLARIQALGTPKSTEQLTVYFDRGHEARALRLRAMVQDAMKFFADSLGMTPALSIAVLEKPAWDRLITWQPYGIPGVEGKPPVAFLPATDDNVAANDAISIERGISDSARSLVALAGMTWQEGSRRYVDLVGLHELGHAFAAEYGISVRSKWFNEWIASYFCYAFLRSQRPTEARLWEGILRGYVDAVQPQHRTIADFEKLYFGVGPQNYVWYQARFQQQVAAAYESRGVALIRELRVAFPSGGASPATQEQLLARLDQLVPGFQAWGYGMR